MPDFEYIARNIGIQPGDIFCTFFPGRLGKVITAVEAFWAKDRKAEYSHAGLLTGPKGETFEALIRLRRQNIWAAYGGSRILMARHPDMTSDLFKAAFNIMDDNEGAWYPAWRLVLHLFPPAARYISVGKFKVCSEWTAHFLNLCDRASGTDSHFMKLPHWKGTNPDHLADMIQDPKSPWQVVWEGELP